MKNNATINSRLKDLLDILDARAAVNIYLDNNMSGAHLIKRDVKVYELLADNDFIIGFKNCEVIGLECGIVTNILIENI